MIRVRRRAMSMLAWLTLAISPTASIAGPDGEWIRGPGNDTGRPLGRASYAAAIDTSHSRLFITGGTPGEKGNLWQLALDETPVRWTMLAPPIPGPGHRIAPALIYDSHRNRLLLIGGYAPASNQYFSDAWQFSLEESLGWQPLNPSGTAPTPRAWHSAIYDSLRDRVVITEGQFVTGALADTWELSLEPAVGWRRIATSGVAPTARLAAGVVHDPGQDQLLLFGGWTSSGRSNEVWSLALAEGGEWVQLMPLGTPPAPRSHGAAVFDRSRRCMVLYGGRNESFFDDVHLLFLNPLRWTHPTASAGPGARETPAGGYDPKRDQMVVFGGLLPDTWVLGLDSLDWHEARTVGSPDHPTVRADHAAVFRPSPPQILLVGGYGGDGGSGMFDEWCLDLLATPVWSRKFPDTPVNPGSHGSPAVFDETNDRMVVFHSLPNTAAAVWASAPGGGSPWTNITPLGNQPPRQEERAAAYDAIRGRLLVTGYAPTGGWDVWALPMDGVSAWTNLTAATPGPTAVWGNVGVYDRLGDQLVFVSGMPGSEVWALRFSPTPHWDNLYVGPGPSERGEYGITFDSRRRRVLVSGGYRAGSYLSDLWEFTLEGTPAWRELHPLGSGIQARGFHSMTYDPVFDRVVVMGGHNGRYLDDTWYLVFDEPTDTRLSLVRSEAGADFADLVWHTANESLTELFVERCEDASDWLRLSRVSPDGSLIRFHDAALRPATKYSYRLTWLEDGGWQVGEVAIVTTSVRRPFFLNGMQPNPARGIANVSFWTPDTRPIDLSVVDIQGRRVLTKRFDGLLPGRHELPLDLTGLRAGVYCVGLENGSERLQGRFVLIR